MSLFTEEAEDVAGRHRKHSTQNLLGVHQATGTVLTTESGFETNTFTYSESGYNPGGSMRQTMNNGPRGSVATNRHN